jgi:hypothetical protein
MHPIVLLGDEAKVVTCFNLFQESANLDAKIGARFAPNITEARKSFQTHPMVLLGDEAQVDARFGLFGDSANLDARSMHSLRRT